MMGIQSGRRCVRIPIPKTQDEDRHADRGLTGELDPEYFTGAPSESPGNPEDWSLREQTCKWAMMIGSSYGKANIRTVKHISDSLFSYITTHGGQCNPPKSDIADLKRVAQDGNIQEMVKVSRVGPFQCCYILIVLRSL